MPNTQGINLLKNIYLFKDLTTRELELVLGIASVEVFMPGDELFIEGDSAHSLYVIKHGSVKIQANGENRTIDIASIGTGSHFGEMAFVDEQKRSASVVIVERTEMICVEFEALRKLIDTNLDLGVKVYRALAHFLAGRLRLTTIDLTYAREKNIRHF